MNPIAAIVFTITGGLLGGWGMLYLLAVRFLPHRIVRIAMLVATGVGMFALFDFVRVDHGYPALLLSIPRLLLAAPLVGMMWAVATHALFATLGMYRERKQP